MGQQLMHSYRCLENKGVDSFVFHIAFLLEYRFIETPFSLTYVHVTHAGNSYTRIT